MAVSIDVDRQLISDVTLLGFALPLDLFLFVVCVAHRLALHDFLNILDL